MIIFERFFIGCALALIGYGAWRLFELGLANVVFAAGIILSLYTLGWLFDVLFKIWRKTL